MMEASEDISKWESWRGKLVVVKYGGNAMGQQESQFILENLVALQKLGAKPVLCHGGGPGINQLLERLQIPTQFLGGLRYTSPEVLQAVEMVLMGQINSALVRELQSLGGRAVGLSGVSDNLFLCSQKDSRLGLVGQIEEVHSELIQLLLQEGYLPVVAPIGTDGKGQSWNINGDTAAGKLAGSLQADMLLLLTDVEGLYQNMETREIISYLALEDVPRLKAEGVIQGGMIPKVEGCVQAIFEGVHQVHILDGRKKNGILGQISEETRSGTCVGRARSRA